MIFLVPYFPPLQDSPGFLALQGILPVSSLLSSNCLLSVRFCVGVRPPPAASGHPSSFRRKSSALRLTADQCPLLVSCPAYVGFHPPPTCAAGGTWLGCGRRGKGDGAPRNGLESLNVSAGVARDRVPSSTLEFPLRFLRCLSLCLPLPLSPYNSTCPYTLPPNGRVFSWSLRAPLPRWTRPSCRPP